MFVSVEHKKKLEGNDVSSNQRFLNALYDNGRKEAGGREHLPERRKNELFVFKTPLSNCNSQPRLSIIKL